ncbi:MAG: hypothetical protein J6B08_07040 [Ruminiclostridium sp.]|nr:hypothetical protein [Ruminiclostridium sp.]
MKNITKYIDSRFTPDSRLSKDENYRLASRNFSEIIAVIEEKLPEDKELIYELIMTRALLETTVGKYMFRKGFRTAHRSRRRF